MYKRKRAGNTITRKINSTKDTAAKADKNHYISNSYLEGFIPIDTEYFTASAKVSVIKIISKIFFYNSIYIRFRVKLYSVAVSLMDVICFFHHN